MKHLTNALVQLNRQGCTATNKGIEVDLTPLITIEGNILKIPIQDGTIPEAGINGLQITDVLKYVNEVFKSLNMAYPCKENSNTIRHIEHAIKEQHFRTVDRIAREVEGKNSI